MKVTKYEHACLVIEENGELLVIDPGIFTSSLPSLSNVAGVVVTHVHPDHIDPEKIKAILNSNPNAQLYTVKAVAEAHPDFDWKVVTGGDTGQAGKLALNFYGGSHAQIHPSYPPTDNVGVFVNDKLYYPGDSFAKPNKPIPQLAVPAAAPWMKLAEAMDYIIELKPTAVFPTHNAVLSDDGNGFHNSWLENACKTAGASFSVLDGGKSLTL